MRQIKTYFKGAPFYNAFLVVGHGGYPHLHYLNAASGAVDAATGAKLVAANDKQHGYATITVDARNISGTMSTIATPKLPAEKEADKGYSYPAGLIELPKGAVVSL